MSNPIHDSTIENELWKIRVTTDELTETEYNNHSEIKQLNDKLASQNLYIKQLKSDLNDEIEKRRKLEKKFSRKEIIGYIIAGFIGAIASLILTSL